MRQINDQIDPRWAWQPYRPTEKEPWDIRKAGHLYRRASFGASHAELQAALRAGPEKAVTALLQGRDGQEDFDKQTAPMARSLARVNDGQRIRDWWLYRILYGPHPLREKLTLFWHNHFATSNAKVQNAGFMLRQYELLRQQALGSFSQLLREMSYDPAMLIWLDGKDSKKGNPNENYARELMELFSLGIGNYTEHDIREAARAFTGWELRGENVVFVRAQHDEGVKTVFGKSGKWKPDDIVRLCLEKPSCPYFIVGKLFRFLVSETIPATKELLEPLASSFGKNFDIKAVVETMLRSNLFFSRQAYRSRIKSPVDFAVGIVRGLEGRIGTTGLAAALDELGQSLFFPPSVKGWDGGQTWLNGQTLLTRQNLSLALTSTQSARFGRRCDPAVVARKYGKTKDTEIVDFFLETFLQNDIPGDARQELIQYAEKARQNQVPVYWTEQDAQDHRVRSLCQLVLRRPEFQLD